MNPPSVVYLVLARQGLQAEPQLQVLDRDQAVGDQRAVGQHRDRRLLLPAGLRQVAHDGLQDVGQGHDPLQAAVFVHDETEPCARLAPRISRVRRTVTAS